MPTRSLPVLVLAGGLSLLALTGCAQPAPAKHTALVVDKAALATGAASAAVPSAAPATDPSSAVQGDAVQAAAAPTSSAVPCDPVTGLPLASPSASAPVASAPRVVARPSKPARVPAARASSRPVQAAATKAPVAAVPAPVHGAFTVFERPFSASSPANALLPATVGYGSASSAQVADLRTAASTAVNSTSWGVTIRLAKSSDPVVEVRSSIDGDVAARVHMPSGAKAPGGSDKAVAIVEPDGYTAYEFYKLSGSGSSWTAKRTEVNDLRGTGADHGARASDTSLLWGIIRQADFREGVIAHTVLLGIPDSALKSGFVAPANAQDSDGDSSYHGSIPMGSRFAIPRDVDVAGLGLDKQGRMLATALQQYGAYVLRRSDSVALYAESDADQGQVDHLRTQWAKLRALLRPVTR